MYPPDYFGGYELGVKEVARELTLLGNEVYIISGRTNNRKETLDEDNRIFRVLHTNLLFLNRYEGIFGKVRFSKDVFFYIYFNPFNYVITRKFVNELKPDVVSLWNPMGISVSPFFSKSKNVLGFIHLADEWMVNWFGNRFNLRQKLLIPNPFRNFISRKLSGGKIIAISLYLQEKLLSVGYCIKDLTLISYGVDTSVFKPNKNSKKSGFTVLYVGQIIRRKGVHNIIAAMNDLVNYDRGMNLLLVGDGDRNYIIELKEMVEALNLKDNVFFTGKIYHTDLVKLYTSSDIFVYPSIFPEPFGMSILEAMACGLPVIGTNVGGIPDIIKHGTNGYLIKENSPNEISKSILFLISNPDILNGIAAEAVKTIDEKFQWKIIAQNILREYQLL